MLLSISIVDKETADKEVSEKEISKEEERRRLSYRLPKLQRGSSGTGEYSVYYGDAMVGKLRCTSEDHDTDKCSWEAELYTGFDPVAYPSKDEVNPQEGQDHVAPSGSGGEQALHSGRTFTVFDGRSWIRSNFDRRMWEASLVGF